jgi:hypothetical protein
VEGPPGPSRTAWKAAEAGLTLLSAALARRAIEQFLTGDGRRTPPPPADATAAAAKGDATKVGEEYSGFSTR